MRSRLIVVEHIYHQAINEQPVGVEARYTRHLMTNEQPYRRKITVREDWQPLDHGWLGACSALHIKNEAAQYQMVPTPEEQREDDARIVELASGTNPVETGNSWLILPGETFRGQPKNLMQLYLRCQRGTATCWLMIFPK
jgi:hypothetical protein